MTEKFCFVFVFAALSLARPLYAQQKIAFTWDDLPAHSSLPSGTTRQQIIDAIISTTLAQHLPAPYGFVNAKPIEDTPDLINVLKAWRSAGFLLGNHTWSHMNLNDQNATLEAWEADLLRNEPVLSKEMGTADFHWLRFPNLSEGTAPDKKQGVRRFLAAHSYKIAGVTMSFSDYAYNEPYSRCVAAGDQTALGRLENSYLEEAAKNLDYAHRMSMALYGRDIPYILLMHVGALDAKLLPNLLEMYELHGVQFISLQEAAEDRFYQNDLDLSLNPVPDTLEEAMRLKGLPLPPREPPSVNLATICR